MEDKKQPIIIKKINVVHGAHGGSWKVAFADFATAMMAFFMVLWLVGQTDAQKRGGIAEYFQNPSMVKGHSEAPTGSIGPGGASMSLISFGTTMEVRKQQAPEFSRVRDGGMAYVSYNKVREQRRLESLLNELKEEVGRSQALKPFKDQLLLEIMPNGLRIQIIDKENRPMFNSGSATLKYHAEMILHQLAKTINNVPNKITITGHTDGSPMSKRAGAYTNWELSSDRANSARRSLMEGGLKKDKIARVIGLADTVLFDKEHPSAVINRRISIVIMKRGISDLAKQDEQSKLAPKVLIQNGGQQLEKVKKVSPSPLSNDSLGIQSNPRVSPLSNDSLEIQSNPRVSQVKTRTSTSGMELRLHGLHQKKKTPGQKGSVNKSRKNKNTQKRTRKRSELDVGSQDSGIIIRNRGQAKSFITLPPIIKPNLIPKIKPEMKK